MAREVEIQLPEKLSFLFQPKRYKVIHGGRGSSKSWSVARTLLLLAASKKVRILCTREVQKSLKDSVHQLLQDQIQAMGLGALFDVVEAEIRAVKTGSVFLFAGLAAHTVESIKSFEGVDIVWVEEGQSVAKRSWEVLTPTIRKAGSEIWITFNPDSDMDETWVRFVETPPADSIVVQMNYTDNPWFTPELEAERAHCERTQSKEDYENIWLGKPRKAARGAIYSKEVAAAYEGGRVCNVPLDPSLPLFAIWDLGWNDCMSIILAQRVASEVRLIDTIEDSQRRIDEYVTEMERRGYRVACHFLPHDGRHKNIQTGKSAEETLRALTGAEVKIVPSLTVEEGIRNARSVWPRVYFDRERCADLLSSLKKYRRHVNTKTGEPGDPVHDDSSHAADAFRYMALVVDMFQSVSRLMNKVVNHQRRTLIRGH